MKKLVPMVTLFAALSTLAHAENTKSVIVEGQPITTQRSKIQTNADVQISLGTGVINPGSQLVYEVPALKRYVVETVSVWTFTTNCSFFITPSITTTSGGEISEFRLPVPDRTFFANGGFYLHSLTLPVKLYADPGSSVFANIFRSAADCSATARVSLSGYLENDE